MGVGPGFGSVLGQVFKTRRQNLACAIILAVRERRREAKSLLRAALSHDPNPSSARNPQFVGRARIERVTHEAGADECVRP